MVADRACVLMGGVFSPGAARTIGRLNNLLGKSLTINIVGLRNNIWTCAQLANYQTRLGEVLPFHTERERSARVGNILWCWCSEACWSLNLSLIPFRKQKSDHVNTCQSLRVRQPTRRL